MATCLTRTQPTLFVIGPKPVRRSLFAQSDRGSSFSLLFGVDGPEEFMPRLRQMAEEAGRDPQTLSVTLGGAAEELDLLKRNRDLGIARMNVRLPPAKTDEILPLLDRWAKLIRQLGE
jgi:hypothetical protein